MGCSRGGFDGSELHTPARTVADLSERFDGAYRTEAAEIEETVAAEIVVETESGMVHLEWGTAEVGL